VARSHAFLYLRELAGPFPAHFKGKTWEVNLTLTSKELIKNRGYHQVPSNFKIGQRTPTSGPNFI
jgi:hypothetical protein